MMEPVQKKHLTVCLEVIAKGYENTAIKFGMTEDNCPYRGRTRLPYQVFEREYNNGCLMYMYLYNKEVVGFLSLLEKEQEVHINDIVVLPTYQNKGIGSKLMQFTKEKAKELSCKKIVLGMVHDNTPLRKWYEKMGFHTVELKKFEKVSYTVGIMELLV